MEDNYQKLEKRAKEIQGVADEISGRFPKLATLEDALLWRMDTLALIRLLEQFCREFTVYRIGQEAALKLAETARSGQSFLKRTFASRSDENQCKENIGRADRAISSIETAVEDLTDLIERTPTNKGEQKLMLQDLRQLKKDLTVEKRSVNESMRQIRTKARQTTASWTGVRGKGVMGSMARYARTSARLGKESALSPYEQEKATIERQLIEVEKRINWTARFTGDTPSEQPPVLRCAYCGRRVGPNQVCAGCGSNRTMVDS